MTEHGKLAIDDNDKPVMGGTSSADNATIINSAFDPATRRLLTDASGGGTGTVTSVSVVTANGFAGSVADPTTTPAITLSTTITGILQGNGTAISAASTTGSGAVVLATSPTLVTPVIGAATGTSLSVSGSLTSATSLILEETGAGTDTITIQAPASIAASYTLTLPVDDGDSGQVLSTNGSGVLSWVSAGGVPTTITVANEATDTSCFIGFFTAATGDLGPKTNANLTFNSNTGVLTAAQTIVGSISGNAATASAVAVGGITGLGTGVATALAINVGSAGAFVTFNGALGTPSSGTVTNLTGTASININGTVGATTPTTGVFTTLVAGSTTSLLLGTAGSAVGNIGFRNATSGTITLTPATGALGTVTLTLPAATDQLVGRATTDTLTNKTLTSPAITTASLSGTQLLAEGASIGLDPAGSADGAYSGITITAVAGYTQAFGDLVYLAVADSRWELADADAAATAGPVALAMVVVAGTDGNACTLLLQGTIRADAKFPTMTVGATQYVGETAGAIQGAIPTGADNIIRTVGYALTADELYFNPSTDWQVTVA